MRFVGVLAMLSMLVAPIAVRTASAEIADAPIYLTSAVEPNIMFVLDDSGSMQWEVMPDSDQVFLSFPRPDLLYGTTYSVLYGSLTSTAGFFNGVARFDPANRYTRYFRTARFNPLYYNPAIRYEPWMKADGSLMDKADPAAASYNPMAAGEGTLNLTADSSNVAAVWINDDGSKTAENVSFYPATYFVYTGPGTLSGPGDANNTQANFTRVEIKSANAPFAKAAARTDCAGANCTYAEEMQNFANWFSYYRSRILSSRAGIGRAFAQQGSNLRVGFGAINKGSTAVDGVNTGTIVRGVRPFAGADRTAFFDSLYTHAMPTAGTPLRRALDDVGQYYSRSDNKGPWGDSPGSSDGAATSSQAQCRQSYSILMTDGYWSSAAVNQATTADAQKNVDGSNGPTITGPGSPPKTFTYTTLSPFTDEHSNTLADVAMYYWNRDLRDDLENDVPTKPLDPAFWQHMTTFGVGLGVSGTIDPATAFDAIKSGATINWPNPTNDAAKLDDLLHASVNGRGGFFSAADPGTFATELSSLLKNITDRISSSSTVASNSTRLSSLESAQLYQARFSSADWSGHLLAYPLSFDGTIGSEIWDAADQIPAHGARNIKTWDGAAGADFSGAVGSLTVAQVNYLRGDDSNETRNGGPFRDRGSKLGDIVNADPLYVKSENFGYNLLPGSEGSSYSTFLNSKNSRTAVVYAGANDGMLHGFRASDGAELFAYVPNATWPNLHLLTSPDYTHKYFVDGSPTAWDAYWGGGWKTVLAGSLGAGGKAVYALNASNPDAFSAADVLWEFQGNDATQKDNMGHVLGSVAIARFADGNYWAVFGNGYESSSGKAALFMVRVDSPSTVKMIELEGGPGNGLSTPVLVDSNGDRIIDLVYAGDLKGNVWKINTSAGSSDSWGPAYGAAPLFQAKDGKGNPQPITSSLEVGLSPAGASGLMVYFGTGKYFATGDNSLTSVQSLYGIVDADGNTGGTSGRVSGVIRDSDGTAGILVQQSVVFEGTFAGAGVRVMSSNTVDYASKKGWVLDLLPPSGAATGERMITAPLLFAGKLLLQTITPSLSPCDYGGRSWLMQVNPGSGGQPTTASFDVNGDGAFNDAEPEDGGGEMQYFSGVDTGVGVSGGFGKPIKAGGKAVVPVTGTKKSEMDAMNIPALTLKARVSWRQIQ